MSSCLLGVGFGHVFSDLKTGREVAGLGTLSYIVAVGPLAG